jgi:hypothetical protein
MPAIAWRHSHPQGRHRAVRYYASLQSAYRFHPLPGVNASQLNQKISSCSKYFAQQACRTIDKLASLNRMCCENLQKNRSCSTCVALLSAVRHVLHSKHVELMIIPVLRTGCAMMLSRKIVAVRHVLHSKHVELLIIPVLPTGCTMMLAAVRHVLRSKHVEL